MTSLDRSCRVIYNGPMNNTNTNTSNATKQEIQAIIPGLIPGLKARVMKAARHLSASRMAANMNHPGRNWRGATKGRMAEGVAEGLCGVHRYSATESLRLPTEVEIEAVCHRFRVAENSDGTFGVIEADREPLVARIAAMRADIAKDAATATLSVIDPMFFKQRDCMALERALRFLDTRRLTDHAA